MRTVYLKLQGLAALLVAAVLCGCGGGGVALTSAGDGQREEAGQLPRGIVPEAAPSRSTAEVLASISSAPAPAGLDPQIFEQLRAELVRVLSARGVSKIGSSAPLSTVNQITEFTPVYAGPGEVEFLWDEKNSGDYDLNGEVNIADLTVIGQQFGKTSESPDWGIAQCADGDGNGEIGIGDVTPVGSNFQSALAGYNVYRSLSGGSAPELVGSVGRGEALQPNSHTMLYAFSDSPGGDAGQGYTYEVRPFSPVAGTDEGIASYPYEFVPGGGFGQHLDPAVMEIVAEGDLSREVLAGELLLNYDETPSSDKLYADVYGTLGAELLGQLPGTSTFRVGFDTGVVSTSEALALAGSLSGVNAQYDYLMQTTEAPVPDNVASMPQPAAKQASLTYSDPRRGELWGLDEMRAGAAWDITEGTGIVVGVIDTGVETSHQDLAGQTVAGARFGGSDAWSDDSNSHGTHVSGSIVATAGNGLGIVGLANKAKVMPLRAGSIISGDWRFPVSDTTAALNYATANGVRVVNMSLGGTGSMGSAFEAALASAEAANVVVCVAAGNSNMNAATFYPAAYPTVLCVGSVGPSLTRASYSNFGYPATVDVCAPGGDIQTAWEQGILSTVPTSTSSYDWKQGTSMACPHAAAAVALVLSANPALTAPQVRALMHDTGRTVAGSSTVGPLIDAQAALIAVSHFSVSGTVKRADNTPVSGISLTLTNGTDSFSATTAAGGAYSISGVANGEYTLTPLRNGWSFTPASLTVTVADGNLPAQNFVAAQVGIFETENNDTFASANALPAFPFEANAWGGSLGSMAGYDAYDGDALDFYKFSTSGPSRVYLSMSFDGSKGNLDLRLLGSNGSTVLATSAATSGSSERIAFSIALAGTYYVKCSKASGYSDYTLSGSLKDTYSVGGKVTKAGAIAVANVALSLVSSSDTFTAKTNSLGDFSLAGVPDGEYTLTPALTGRSFLPPSAAITVAGSALSGEDFTCEGPFTVGGSIIQDSKGVAGVTCTLSKPGLTLTAKTGSTGVFSITNVVNGTYTLTPSLAGRSFTPASAEVTVSSGNVTGVNFASEGPFTVSGHVNQIGGANLAGATLTLTGGGSTYIAKSASTGNFTVMGVPNGTFTLTPSMAGRTFTPVNAEVTVSHGNVSGFSFEGVGPFTVGGTVLMAGDLPLSGVKLTLSGTGGTYSSTTNTLGVFNVIGVRNGEYTLTPSRVGYGFSETSVSVTVSGGNITGQAFSAFKVFSIAGAVTGVQKAGVTITVTDGGSITKTATTSATGVYSVTGLPAGTYTVTPSYSGRSFTPASRSVVVSAANVSAVSFGST